MSSLSSSGIGALMLIAAFTFNSRNIFVTLSAWLGFLGVVLLGTTGWIGRTLTDVTGFAERVAGNLGGYLVGSAEIVVIGIFLVAAVHYLHDVLPRKGRGARPATLYYGVALGAIIVAGATGIPALSGLHQAIVTAITSL